jgi:hypothetical protein
VRSPGVLVEFLGRSRPAAEEEWFSWYDRTYLAARAQVPGVIAARRGTGVVGSVQSMAVYDLADFLLPRSREWLETDRRLAAERPPGAVTVGIESTLYRQILSTVEPYEPPEPGVLHGAFFEVEPEHHSEFNDWYDTEHIRFLDVIAGYRNCRRFQSLEDPRKFLALYDVESLAVAEHPETARANDSPWSDRVRGKLVAYRERRLFTIDRFERP